MTVGAQANTGTIDNTLTTLSLGLRDLMDQINSLWTFVGNGADGTPATVLAGIGYDNTNTDAPGDQSDAAYASYLITMMNTLAQIYYGQTAPTAYNYEGALAPLWAGRLWVAWGTEQAGFIFPVNN